MRTIILAAVGMAVLTAGPASAEVRRMMIATTIGPIFIEVDLDKAPVTACNFIRYVADGAYDGGRFFRTVRRDRPGGNPNPIDVIQAEAREGEDQPDFGPIPLERTRDTGLTHVAGALSMARDGPDTATHNFFIVTEDTPSLDFGGARNPDGQGFAVFGRVLFDVGLDIVRRIQMSPSNDEEQLTPPVTIRRISMSDPFPEQCGV